MPTKLKNCLIADGLGNELKKAELVFEAGKISALEDSFSGFSEKDTVDCGDSVLCPGFIDTHSHSDISIMLCPEATGKISQGITTEIVGNCGMSAFPVNEKNIFNLKKYYNKYGVDISWSNFQEYASELEMCRPSVNIASLCGHNTLRASVCAYENCSADSEELNSMRRTLERELSSGAFGLSTGLLYVPGKFADESEIISLLDIVANSAKIYATHLRSEGDEIESAIKEAIQLCLKSKQKKLHISHLKIAKEKNWHKFDSIIQMIESLDSVNLNITADRYPYTEGMTQLSVILPPPWDKMTDLKITEKLQSDNEYFSLLDKLRKFPENIWEEVRLIDCDIDEFVDFAGLRFSEISEKCGLDSPLLCMKMLRKSSPEAMASFAGMSRTNMEKIISKPYVCCGTDETDRPLSYEFGRSHPRGFGSFPEFINLRTLRNSLSESIRACTSKPADIFGIAQRGILEKGFYADMVLFDPCELCGNADYAFPHKLSGGIEKVWVNGRLTYDMNYGVCSRNGKVLK